MKWILIFWMFNPSWDTNNYGVPSSTATFDSEASCKEAFRQMKAVNGGELHLRGVCVKSQSKAKELPDD